MQDTDDISFMYDKNNNGPNVDPCGTHVINLISEEVLLLLTY